MNATPFDLAKRFTGLKELPGTSSNNPQIMAMFMVDGNTWVTNDETAWCSAFVNYVCHLFGELARSRKLNARSWLKIGVPVELDEAVRGFDVVVLQRGDGIQPGPEVLDAPGHVGFFTELSPGKIWLLGGNQGNTVSVASFDVHRVLGVRRLGV